MTPDQVFSVANGVALLSWILLAAFPRRAVIAKTTGLAVPSLLAATYILIVVIEFSHSAGGFSSLADVALLFSNRWMLLAGWIHYLAFDLLVGNWEILDARQRGVPYALVLPCLALTFLFGPAGWLAYLGIRTAAGNTRGLVS